MCKKRNSSLAIYHSTVAVVKLARNFHACVVGYVYDSVIALPDNRIDVKPDVVPALDPIDLILECYTSLAIVSGISSNVLPSLLSLYALFFLPFYVALT